MDSFRIPIPDTYGTHVVSIVERSVRPAPGYPIMPVYDVVIEVGAQPGSGSTSFATLGTIATVRTLTAALRHAERYLADREESTR